MKRLVEFQVEEQAHGHVDVEEIVGDHVVARPEVGDAPEYTIENHKYMSEEEEDRQPKDELHFLSLHSLDFAHLGRKKVFVSATIDLKNEKNKNILKFLLMFESLFFHLNLHLTHTLLNRYPYF